MVKRAGNKAVAFINISVLVEIDATEDFYTMMLQAEEKLKKHVVEGVGFFPFRQETTMIQENTTLDDVVQKTTIQPSQGWDR